MHAAVLRYGALGHAAAGSVDTELDAAEGCHGFADDRFHGGVVHDVAGEEVAPKALGDGCAIGPL